MFTYLLYKIPNTRASHLGLYSIAAVNFVNPFLGERHHVCAEVLTNQVGLGQCLAHGRQELTRGARGVIQAEVVTAQ